MVTVSCRWDRLTVYPTAIVSRVMRPILSVASSASSTSSSNGLFCTCCHDRRLKNIPNATERAACDRECRTLRYPPTTRRNMRCAFFNKNSHPSIYPENTIRTPKPRHAPYLSRARAPSSFSTAFLRAAPSPMAAATATGGVVACAHSR